MTADHHGVGLVVVRNEAESGRCGLRLIGELDFSTIKAFDAQLGDTREQSRPSVIDVSELRFLDLTGLCALRRAGQGEGSLDTHWWRHRNRATGYRAGSEARRRESGRPRPAACQRAHDPGRG